MQATTTEATEQARAIFSPLPQPSFAARLVRAFAEGAREFASSPVAYLRIALLPAHLSDWLPARLASAVAWFFSHPLSGFGGLLRRDRLPVGFINPTTAHTATFVTNALAPSVGKGKAAQRAWDRFVPTLVASGAVHSLLIVLLVYLTILNMIAPYTHVVIVNHPYRKFSDEQVNELYARSRPIKQPTEQVLSLEELRERERQRALERERRRAEEEARLKAEREKAERAAKAAEEKAKAEEAAKAANANGPMKFGEINEAAIKDMITQMFESYKKGELDVGNYTVTIAFKINCDGSMPRSSIRTVKSSPQNPKKERLAQEILWLIGESHAMGPLCQFSSNTIEFVMNDEITRLSIAGFGPTPEWTNEKATQLKALFLGISLVKGNSDTGQLAKLVKVHPDGKRLVVDLTVSRERANELVRANQRPNSQ